MVGGFSWLDLKMAKTPQCKVGFVSSDQTQNIKTKRGRISIYDLTSSAFKSLSKFNFWREKLPRKEVFSLFIWYEELKGSWRKKNFVKNILSVLFNQTSISAHFSSKQNNFIWIRHILLQRVTSKGIWLILRQLLFKIM